MDITCVIPHSRSIELLWATYASAKQAGIDQFVLVNNGVDHEPPVAMSVLHSSSHLGPAMARDCGMEYVSTEYAFFLDDDSILPCDIFDDVPDADCVLYPSTTWGTATYYELEEPAKGTDLTMYGANTSPKSNIPYPVWGGPGGSMLVKLDSWLKIGGYGELCDGYGPDELLLGHRMKQAGMKVLLDPRFIVWHYPSRETYKNRDENFVQRYRKVEKLIG